MSRSSEAFDISIFWMARQESLDRKSLAMPEATACGSLSDALAKATSSATEAAGWPWIRVEGVLFSPVQVAVLRRITMPAA